MKALKTELSELKKARSALETDESGSSEPTTNDGPTIKDMVKAVLKDDPSGATSSQILERIEQEYGQRLQRTSLSPQLSRLKSEGEVSQIGNNWILAELLVPDAQRGAHEDSEAQDFDRTNWDDDSEVPF